MRALRFHGKEDIRLDEIPEPELKDGWVKIKPAYVGICGTDLHEYTHGANLIPRPGHPHPLTHETLPLTLGHEFSGTITALGAGVSKPGLHPGAKVVVQPTIYDGVCSACVEGATNCCEKNGFVGLSGWGGGLSEVVCVPEKAVVVLPEGVSLMDGALVEPLTVAWHAVSRSPFTPQSTILILGAGPIGLAVLQVLIARGVAPENIIMTELAARRKEFAASFGASVILDPSTDDVVARVREVTHGKGVDVGFDCAGVQIGLQVALKCIRAKGTLVNVAVWPDEARLDMFELVFRERGYIGTACYVEGEFEEVLQAMASGKLKPQAMITRKIQIDEVEEKGFKALVEDKGNHVKILVEVDGEASA